LKQVECQKCKRKINTFLRKRCLNSNQHKVKENSFGSTYNNRRASDQLQSIQLGAAKSNYSYNSHGEPVQISTAQGPSTSSGQATQTRDLTYGARGELLAIADNGQPTASYQYNHALQRVSKTTKTDKDSQTTNYLWHGGMIDAEIQNGQVTKRYIFINLRPVAVIEYENDENNDQNSHKNNSTSGSKYAGYKPKSTAIYAIHTDHLGTPQAITDDKQAVVWRADYATFGRATVQARVADGSSRTAKTSFGIISTANAATTTAKPFEFNLRFAGQYEDTESGYHYNWHRYYDPSTGRYLTPDPIGLAGGLNGYGYAGQDPMGAVDPWGLWVVGVYNKTTGILTMTDTEKGTTITGTFESGGKPFGDPIPNRKYDLLEQARRDDFFRLEPLDSHYGDDKDEATGRTSFRLHKPGRTIGCIASKDQNEWAKFKDFINSTLTTTAVVDSKSKNPFAPKTERITAYGTLEVVE
jgi:RHS repeat-associated protein